MTQIIWCATRGNLLRLTIVRPAVIHYTLESIQYLNFKLDIKTQFPTLATDQKLTLILDNKVPEKSSNQKVSIIHVVSLNTKNY